MDFFSQGHQSSSNDQAQDAFAQAINARFNNSQAALLTSQIVPSPGPPSVLSPPALRIPPRSTIHQPAPIPPVAGPSRISNATSSAPPAPSATSFPPYTPATLQSLLSDPHTLILDLRPLGTHYNARIPHALSLSVPSTLLKRPLFSTAKLAEMLPTEAARRKFSQWRSAHRILVYDADSSNIQEGSNILGLLRKFCAEGAQPSPDDADAMVVERELTWLKGGFQAVWRERRDLIDSNPPPDEDELDDDEDSPPPTSSVPSTTAPTALSLTDSGNSSQNSFQSSALSLPTSISSMQSKNSNVLRTKRLPMSAFGVSSTTSSQRSGSAHHQQYLDKDSPLTAATKTSISPNVAYNPFYDAIRQNLELSHGITEKIPLKISREAKERIGELPFAWLREIGRWASAEDKHRSGSREGQAVQTDKWREPSSAGGSGVVSSSSSESGGKERDDANVRFEDAARGQKNTGEVSPNTAEGMEALAMQFYRIELGEQRRLMGVMEHHSKESGHVVNEGKQSQEAAHEKKKGRKCGKVGGIEGVAHEGEGEKHVTGEADNEKDQGSFPFSIIAGIEKGAKNRYRNIWPFEHARVRLQKPRPDNASEGASHSSGSSTVLGSKSSQGATAFPYLESAVNVQSHEKKVGFGSPLSTSSKSAAGRAGGGEDVVDSDDYVNASYVQPLGTKKKYIATQGPLPETFVDFWTLVWEQNVSVIVMLTREMEGMTIKCGNYWSDSVYGPLRLSLVSTTAAESNTSRDPAKPSQSEAPSFFPVQASPSAAPEQTGGEETIKRVFHLSHSAYPQLPPRRVVQLQYLAWPDFNVPNDSWGLLKLIKQVDEEVENSERDRLEWETIKAKKAATVKRNPVSTSTSAPASSACTPSVTGSASASALALGGCEEGKSPAGNESVAGDTDSEFVSTPSTDDMDSETGIVWNALAKRPILLHCSAGVGRTGGYIAVDAVLDGVKNEMRKRREAAGVFATTSRSRSGSRRLSSDSDGASPHEEATAMDVDDGGLVMSLPVGTDNPAGRQVGLSVHVPVVGISTEEKERDGGDDARLEALVEDSAMQVDEQKQPPQAQPADSQSPWLMLPHSQGLMKWTPGVGATIQSSRPHISHHFSHSSNAPSLGPSRRRLSSSIPPSNASPPSRSTSPQPSEPPESGSGSSGSSLSLPFANPSNPATAVTTPFSFPFSKLDPSSHTTPSSESSSSSPPSSSSHPHSSSSNPLSSSSNPSSASSHARPIMKLPATTPNAARHRTWSAPNHTPMLDKNKTPSAAITPATFNLKMPSPKSSAPRFGGVPSRPIHLGSKPNEPPSSVFALHHHQNLSGPVTDPSSMRSSLNSPLVVASERYTSSPLALHPEPPASRSGSASASNPRQRYNSSPVTGLMQQVQQSASLPVPLRHPHAHVQQSQAQTQVQHPILTQEPPHQQHPQPEKQSSGKSMTQEPTAETFDYTKPRRLHSARTTPLMLSDLDEPVRRVVEDMREQRMSLCQSLRQYVFVHRAILEGVLQLVDEEREMYGDVWMDADLGMGQAAKEALGPAMDLAGLTGQPSVNPSASLGTVHQPDQPNIIISPSPSPSKGKRGASPTELPIKDKMGVLKLSKRPSIKRVQGQRSGEGGQSEPSEGREGSSSGGALARVGEGVKMQQPMHDSFITRSLPPGLAPP